MPGWTWWVVTAVIRCRPLPPIKDALPADGNVVVPIETGAFGFWLKAAFGAPIYDWRWSLDSPIPLRWHQHRAFMTGCAQRRRGRSCRTRRVRRGRSRKARASALAASSAPSMSPICPAFVRGIVEDHAARHLGPSQCSRAPGGDVGGAATHLRHRRLLACDSVGAAKRNSRAKTLTGVSSPGSRLMAAARSE